MMSENIIKLTCKELGMTYRQLGDAVGYSEGAIKNAALAPETSPSMQKAIELYLETIELKNKLQASENFKQHLKDFLQE
jgi:hypothetical protein